jgi:K+-sensing histidine kinase KdpD
MVLIDIDSSKLELSVFHVCEVIKEAVTAIEKRVREKNIDILTSFESEDAQFRGDRKRIRQLLFNLIINATQNTPVSGKIEIRETSENNNLKIIIKNSRNVDEGGDRNQLYKHSAKAYIHRILESNIASMSIVRSLIELHGGKLNVSSDSNGWSYVICSLPINYHHAGDGEAPDENADNSSEITEIEEISKETTPIDQAMAS